MDYHTLKLFGVKRNLPLIKVGRNTKIASFSILGDVELVNILADNISKKLRKYDFDYLVGPEVKVVPLIHGIAKRLGHKKFIVCRRSVKSYMVSPIILNPLSHFPKHSQKLVLDGQDAKLLKGKKVIILDDVISTGVTIRMLTKLMGKVGAEVVKIIVVLKQGEQFDKNENLIYLESLPIFKTKS